MTARTLTSVGLDRVSELPTPLELGDGIPHCTWPQVPGIRVAVEPVTDRLGG